MAADIVYSREAVPAPKGPPPTHLRPLKRFQGKRERDQVFKLETLRAELPYLTRQETSEYRNTFYQNLCLNILKLGYQRTFSELFSLIQRQDRSRKAAGPDSVLWNVVPLDHQPDKLTVLRDALCQAEDAKRQGDFQMTYKAYFQLATFFQDHPDDKWLVDHYFSYCLDVSAFVKDDDGLKSAEAHLNMGKALELNGDHKAATEHFKEYYQLTSSKEWSDKGGNSLHAEACENLARMYTTLAETTSSDCKEQVKYYNDAYEMAKESGNKKLEGQCGYRLGLAYEKVGNATMALKFLRGFYDLSRAIHDDENLGLACEAMAKAFERQGKFEEGIKFLEEFVEVTARSGQDQLHSRACRELGAVYNRMHNYGEAAKYFKKAFSVASSLQDTGAANEARLMCGVAIGNKMANGFSFYVETTTRKSLEKELEWKNVRGDSDAIFAKPIEDKPLITLATRKPSRAAKKMTKTS